MAYYASPLPVPHVFDNWSDCQSYINGLSATVYRKFNTMEEARAYAYRSVKVPTSDDLIAYTDGSYNSQNNVCGSGIVFVQNDIVQDELSFSSPNVFDGDNIIAEANAVLKALEYCAEKGIKRIFICHDLIHLAEYVREYGCYDAKTDATLDYRNRYRDLVDKHELKVYFNWIKGHGTNQWNNRADRLAGLASGKYQGE